MSDEIVIIGGGVSGLVAAYELSQVVPDATIRIIERSDEVGGKLKTIALGEDTIDVGAEAYLAFREDATDFFNSLGLAEKLKQPGQFTSGLWIGDGELHDLPRRTVMGIPATSSAVGNLIDEDTAALIDSEKDRAPIDWNTGQDCTVGRLVEERFGRQVVDRLVTPLLGGVYSASADDLSLRSTIPQLARALDERAESGEPVYLSDAAAAVMVQRERASEARLTGGTQDSQPRAVFQTFDGGYQDLIDSLVSASGVQVITNTQATDLQRVGDRWHITVEEAHSDHQNVPSGHEHSDVITCDAIIMAVPAPQAAELVTHLSPIASAALGTIELSTSAVVALVFDESVDIPEKTGILVSPDCGLDAKAFTFSSQKWPHVKSNLGGRGLIRASFGRFGDDHLVHLPDDELIRLARKDLKTVAGISHEPTRTYVQRWWGGIPRLAPGHRDTIADALEQLRPHGTLGVVGAYVSGVGIPDCISHSRAEAKRVALALDSGAQAATK